MTVEAPAEVEVKTKLRGEHHARLQALKTLGRGTIRENIERALDLYFERLHEEREAHNREAR